MIVEKRVRFTTFVLALLVGSGTGLFLRYHPAVAQIVMSVVGVAALLSAVIWGFPFLLRFLVPPQSDRIVPPQPDRSLDSAIREEATRRVTRLGEDLAPIMEWMIAHGDAPIVVPGVDLLRRVTIAKCMPEDFTEEPNDACSCLSSETYEKACRQCKFLSELRSELIDSLDLYHPLPGARSWGDVSIRSAAPLTPRTAPPTSRTH